MCNKSTQLNKLSVNIFRYILHCVYQLHSNLFPIIKNNFIRCPINFHIYSEYKVTPVFKHIILQLYIVLGVLTTQIHGAVFYP
jgi:hypothetical protein